MVMVKQRLTNFFVRVMILLLFISSVSPAIVRAELTGNPPVYHTDFSDGNDRLTVDNGTAERTTVSIDGTDTSALKVSDRVGNYYGADLTFANANMEDGRTYSITVNAYIGAEEVVPDGAELLIQNIESYDGLYLNAPMVAGETITLQGEYTVNPDVDRAIRIQSNEPGATVSFYLTQVTIEDITPIETPVEEPTAEFTPFTVKSFDFEAGTTDGFVARGDSVNIAVTDEAASTGSHSLKVSGREANWHGAAYDLTSLLQQGARYKITGDVQVVDPITDAETLKASMLSTVSGETAYPTIQEFSVSDNGWMAFEGEFILDYEPDQLLLYVEATTENLSYYLDNVVITMVAPGEVAPNRPAAPVLETITFEDETTGGFAPRGEVETVTVTNETNHTESGNFSLKVEGREQNWNGPSLNVIDYVDQGDEYLVSAWVKMASGESAELQLSTQVGTGDTASYNNITAGNVTDAEWVKLEGTYRYSSLGQGALSIYVESNNATASFYVDDVSFTKTAADEVVVEDITPLKDIYQNDFLIGNAVSMSEFDGIRLEMLNKHHNLVSAENAMKPSYAYDADGNFDFTGEDALVERAIEEGFDVHGHVLVWHQQSREALYQMADGTPLSREEALNNMYTHIETVMTHFAKYDDNLISWDVVNEAIRDDARAPYENWEDNLRESGWLKAIGTDYLELAYKKAREVADRLGLDVVLYYNDYNDDQQNKAQAIYHMIKDINARYSAENNGELLIQGMGMQSHYNMNTNPENVRLSMERFIDLGVEIGVTELDVTAGDGGVQTEAQANRQAFIYASLFHLYKEHSEHISRVTLWGLNDATSWRSEQTPLLFDNNMKAKLAYEAVANPEAFLANYQEEEVPVRQNEALYTNIAPVLDGKIDDVWQDAPRLAINRFQQAWATATGVARILWDDNNLYVLFEISDSVLDASNENAWEQDSIEVFLDQENGKASSYPEVGVGQYRVNFNNERSAGAGGSYDGFDSAVTVNGSSYVAEMIIPLSEINPTNGDVIGFDAQVNDAADGARAGVATWNDTTGQGYQDPSVFGEVTLVNEASDESEETVVPVDNEAIVVYPGEKIKVENSQTAVTMPLDLPIGTTIEINKYQQDQYLSDDGEALTPAGEMITIDLTFPAGEEDYTGDFVLELGYDTHVNEVAIFYLGESGWEFRGGEMANGIIRITVPGFSTYGVFEVATNTVPEEEAETPTNETEAPTNENSTTDDSTAGDADAADSNEEVDVENGEPLPNTATSMFNVMTVGFYLLLIGAAFLYLSRKKA